MKTLSRCAEWVGGRGGYGVGSSTIERLGIYFIQTVEMRSWMKQFLFALNLTLFRGKKEKGVWSSHLSHEHLFFEITSTQTPSHPLQRKILDRWTRGWFGKTKNIKCFSTLASFLSKKAAVDWNAGTAVQAHPHHGINSKIKFRVDVNVFASQLEGSDDISTEQILFRTGHRSGSENHKLFVIPPLPLYILSIGWLLCILLRI